MAEVPFSKTELENMLVRSGNFGNTCYAFDSLGRGMAWSQLSLSIAAVIKEEEYHNFEYPSPHNPENK